MLKALRSLFHRRTTMPSVDYPDKLAAPISASVLVSTAAEHASEIFVDIETTGLNDDGADEILEVAIVDADGAILLNTPVRPKKKIEWPRAQAIHGISPQDVADAPTLDALVPEITAICSGKTVVFYNAPFDISFFPSGFFPSVKCAMRRFSELRPESGAWVKLSDAAIASGYEVTGKYHRALDDALACRHIWQVGIPALEKAYPAIANIRIIAKIFFDEEESVSVVFSEIFPGQLRFMSEGDRCALWTRADREEINIYRPGVVGGAGKIAVLQKLNNPKLTEYLVAGHKVHMVIKNRLDDTLMCEIEVQSTREMRLAQALPSHPVKFNPIDDEVYKCFVAHRSGMCEAIGTWDIFQRLEDQIAELCKSKGGRYFKTKAKGAKFAIIFSPYALSAGEVWCLQQEGYKVTSFDQAITHFGLEGWDCTRYRAFVKNLNSGFEELI